MPATIMHHELASAHEERKRLDARIRELEEALRPFAEQRWHRGPEELPEYSFTVLVWHAGRHMLAERYDREDPGLGWWSECSDEAMGQDWSCDEPTYWMPLPEPPK